MDRFTARRKLLRGSLSAPLVLTVTAAGAQVRTTFGACLEQTANQTPPQQRLAEIGVGGSWGDTWYRVPTEVIMIGTTRYLKQFSGSLYYVLDATSPYTTPPSGDPVSLPSGTQTKQQVAALAFFNQFGNVIGYAWENNNNGAFTSKSCYASVF